MRAPRKPWFWFWMTWVGVFIVAETVALLNPSGGDTLSESVWFLQRAWAPLTLGLSVLFVFLIVHFLVDKRGRK